MSVESSQILLTPWRPEPDTIERARRGIGWPWRSPDEDLVVSGRSRMFENAGSFEWRFGRGGRFRRDGDGPLVQTVGFDGTTPWMMDSPGRVRPLAWGEIENARILSLVLGGDWLSDDSGLEVERVTGGSPDGEAPVLRLRLSGQEATMTLDPRTWAPRSLELRPSFGHQTWRFEDFTRHGDRLYPARIEQSHPGGIVNRFEADRVGVAPPAPASFYAAPTAAARARFAAGVTPDVTVERSSLGFLLVRPRIDGREIGAFIFDTGAGTNVITPRAAAALALPRIGTGWLGLAAGATTGDVRRAGTLELGPLTIDRPIFVEMDLDAVSQADGVEISGIIGYDVLMRAVVEIEVATPRIAVHDPAAYAGDHAWQPIVIYGNHVYVSGRFEGHDAMFRLDTGAPQVPLILNAPAVERLGLLEGREVQRARIGVPGGMMDVAMGKVEGLELAGRRFETLAAIFPLESGGAFSDIHSTGNIGQECLKPFRAVFDYPRRRAAFVERERP